MSVIWIVLAVAAALAFCEFIRRSATWLGLLVFAVLPIAMGGLWAETGSFSWFQWAKVYSVCIAASGVLAMRTEWMERRDWTRAVLVGILFVNICEAVVADYGGTGMQPNIVAGLGLLLLLAPPSRVWVAVTEDGRELRYGLPAMWLAAYTVWNFAFVYNSGALADGQGASAAFAIAHLVTPLLFMKCNPARWAEARAWSLAAFMMWRFTFPTEPLLARTPEWHNANVAATLQWLALVVVILTFVDSWRRGRSDGENWNIVAVLAARTRPAT